MKPDTDCLVNSIGPDQLASLVNNVGLDIQLNFGGLNSPVSNTMDH